MGLFKITLPLRKGEPPYPTEVTTVFREFPGTDLEAVWHKLEIKSQEKWGRDLKGFDCVMISKRSEEFKKYKAAQEARRHQPKLQVVPPPPTGSGHQHPFAKQEMKRTRH